MKLHSKTGNYSSSDMKKTVLTILTVILFVALLLLLLGGIQRLITMAVLRLFVPQDWTVLLPNGYEIWRINSESIVLVKATSEGEYDTVVDAYINAYFYDAGYIGLWCAADGSDDLLGVAPERDRFYLIDTQAEFSCEPLSFGELEALCKDLPIPALDLWTKTSPAPGEAAYPVA